MCLMCVLQMMRKMTMMIGERMQVRNKVGCHACWYGLVSWHCSFGMMSEWMVMRYDAVRDGVMRCSVYFGSDRRGMEVHTSKG